MPAVRAGRVSESAALATVLQAQGVTAAHTKAAPSEALLFGIAGGIGGAYWVFDYKEIPYPLLSVFTRHAWDSSRRFLEGACTRLGLTHTFKETTSVARAEKTLRDALAAGRSPIVWGCRAPWR